MLHGPKLVHVQNGRQQRQGFIEPLENADKVDDLPPGLPVATRAAGVDPTGALRD